MCRDFPGTSIDSRGALHHCQPHVQWQCFFQARGRRTSFCGHFGGPLVLTPCFKVKFRRQYLSFVALWQSQNRYTDCACWHHFDLHKLGHTLIVHGCSYSLNWLWFIELYTYTHTRIHSCSWVDLHDMIHSVFDLWNFAGIAAHQWADHEIAVRSNRCSILDDEFSLGDSQGKFCLFSMENQKRTWFKTFDPQNLLKFQILKITCRQCLRCDSSSEDRSDCQLGLWHVGGFRHQFLLHPDRRRLSSSASVSSSAMVYPPRLTLVTFSDYKPPVYTSHGQFGVDPNYCSSMGRLCRDSPGATSTHVD